MVTLTLGRLIALALGDRARLVDTAIPQHIANQQTPSQRNDTAGWYYEPETCRVFGRLLTKTECWERIRGRMRDGLIVATFTGLSFETAPNLKQEQVVVETGDTGSVLIPTWMLSDDATWNSIRQLAEPGVVELLETYEGGGRS